MLRFYHSLFLLGAHHRVLDVRVAMQGFYCTGMRQVVHGSVRQARRRGTVYRMSPGDYIRHTTFMSHVIMLVYRFMMTIRKNCEATTFGLGSKCTRSADFVYRK